MSALRRYLPFLTLSLAISALYLYELDGVGVLSSDEPRYAAIGRAMAQSGDFITPKLWGSPWFEKPPLLYWMTALGTIAGLNRELSARLPVALLSLAFMGTSFWMLRDEFGSAAAAVSIALLATSAGWIVYSAVAVTDLPLAVFFSLAVFLALPLLRREPKRGHLAWRFIAIGVCIGLGTLAKGLVPIALALPFFWFLRRFWPKWWLAFAACIVVAAPWYLAIYARNGNPFIQDFFLKHHFQRLYSASLQHVQPWYYYFPVLAGGLFPWTPLTGLLASRETLSDERRRFLLAVFAWGFVLFSVTLNKLPGYLLPLFPAVFTLVAARFESKRITQFSRAWLIPCALLIATIPLFASLLPQILSLGRLPFVGDAAITRTGFFYVAAPIIAVFLARRSWAGVLLILCVVSSGIYFKDVADPVLDQQVSARGFWRELRDIPGTVCDGGTDRDWVYGLSFYRGSLISPCGTGTFDFAIQSHGHGPPAIERLR